MIRTTVRVLFLLFIVGLVGGAFAEGEQTLNGSFVWARDDGDETGDLEAIFTPDGEDSWKVTFNFVWEGEDRTWSGTAEGSLGEGALSGKVLTDNPDKPTTFLFKGTFTDGKFSGTHGQEDEEGELHETGTLTLAG